MLVKPKEIPKSSGRREATSPDALLEVGDREVDGAVECLDLPGRRLAGQLHADVRRRSFRESDLEVGYEIAGDRRANHVAEGTRESLTHVPATAPTAGAECDEVAARAQ